MSIEIKSIGGGVLYVAKDATDVRTALQEAVKDGAYLTGANLDGAYLAGANLDGANLDGAYLVRANLAGANLAGANLDGANLAGANLARAYLVRANLDGAYLAGANLAGANLDGANLAGANLARANLDGAYLDGAYLAGANLDGANLTGAYLDGAMWGHVADKLEVALQAMNDGGKHWIKGSLTGKLDDGSLTYCSIGSIDAHSDGTVRALALWLLGSVCGGDIVAFNDYPATSWEDVQQVFSVAVMHARRLAAK
jgi:hypothetical protein